MPPIVLILLIRGIKGLTNEKCHQVVHYKLGQAIFGCPVVLVYSFLYSSLPTVLDIELIGIVTQEI